MTKTFNKLRYFDFTIFIGCGLLWFFGIYGLLSVYNPESNCYICKDNYDKAYQQNKIICKITNSTNSTISHKEVTKPTISGYCLGRWIIYIIMIVTSMIIGTGYLITRLCFAPEDCFTPDSVREVYPYTVIGRQV